MNPLQEKYDALQAKGEEAAAAEYAALAKEAIDVVVAQERQVEQMRGERDAAVRALPKRKGR